MNLIKWVGQHFLAVMASLAAIWWFTASENVEQLAFFSFAVIYGAYYIERTKRTPMKNFRMARGQLMFDVVLCVFMAIVTIGGQSNKMDIAAAAIFVTAITGTDLVQFIRIRRSGDKQ